MRFVSLNSARGSTPQFTLTSQVLHKMEPLGLTHKHTCLNIIKTKQNSYSVIGCVFFVGTPFWLVLEGNQRTTHILSPVANWCSESVSYSPGFPQQLGVAQNLRDRLRFLGPPFRLQGFCFEQKPLLSHPPSCLLLGNPKKWLLS